jgi:hypothetical protein
MTRDKVETVHHEGRRKNYTNVQIQGQRPNCLFEAAKEDRSKIEDVILLVRVIETSSEEVKRPLPKRQTARRR